MSGKRARIAPARPTRRLDSSRLAGGQRGAQSGQASLMMLAAIGALLAGVLVLFAFGNALGAKGRHQRAADLAAISAAQVMRDLYPRLFEPPFIEPAVPNPRHLEEGEYRTLAVAAAVRGGLRNGVRIRPADVTFPGATFAPTRVRVRVRETVEVGPAGHAAPLPVEAGATAELLPGGGYDGPLAYRQGKPTPHLFPAL